MRLRGEAGREMWLQVGVESGFITEATSRTLAKRQIVEPKVPYGAKVKEWIKRKRKKYGSPDMTKKGVKKGQSFPYSAKKYHALLLSVTDLPGVRQAEIVGISHGLLRNWRNQPRFKWQSTCYLHICNLALEE